MIADACEFVAARLRTAGVSAEHDPRDLNLPAAWVTPGELTLNRLNPSAGSAEVIIALVVPDVGGKDALTMLDGLLTKAIAADVGITAVEPGTVQLENHAPGGLPALIATVTIDLS